MAGTTPFAEVASEILELFGVRTNDGDVSFGEGKNAAKGKIVIQLTEYSSNSLPSITPTEARHLASRLNALADRVERKANASRPCDACGKA